MKRIDWAIAGLLGVVAAVLFSSATVSFAFPGESAHVLALLRGLDVAEGEPYPVMRFFARLLGGGNALAPVCGALSTALVYVLATRFASRAGTDRVARLAGLAAAILFALSPTILGGATHLEPRLFGLSLALASVVLFATAPYLGRGLALFITYAGGALWGVSAVDQPLTWWLTPLLPFAFLSGRRRDWNAAAIFLAAASVAFAFMLYVLDASFFAALAERWRLAAAVFEIENWTLIFVVAPLPLAMALALSRPASSGSEGTIRLFVHLGISFLVVQSLFPPTSPAFLLAPQGLSPVASVALSALSAAYLVAFWWREATHGRRILGGCAGGLLVLALGAAVVYGSVTDERRKGGFADCVAHAVLDELGDRKWLISDGTLDDHLRLAAAARGRRLELVSLAWEHDETALRRLSNRVQGAGLGGGRNRELVASLSLGVRSFVQTWFATDPSVITNVAVFGSADLWRIGGYEPVPGFFLFGADAARTLDGRRWEDVSDALAAPDGWGSRQLAHVREPIERMRLDLRRYLGMVAVNRGVWLQDCGRDNEAAEYYDLVWETIDGDNVSALLNAHALADAGLVRDAKKTDACRRRLDAIIADKRRRYDASALAAFYGTVRNPQALADDGRGWARSGCPDQALRRVGRALELASNGGGKSAELLKTMASLYAADEDRTRSRAIYEQVLKECPSDRDALFGLMRLALAEGDGNQAVNCLERAIEVAADGTTVDVERAALAFLKGDLETANSLLRTVTRTQPENLDGWSLRAAVVMAQCDRADVPQMRAAFVRELEDEILSGMRRQVTEAESYRLHALRAEVLLRKDETHRVAARDAYFLAAKNRPDRSELWDAVLSLDLMLADVASAEAHAKEVLRRSRKSPLANYVLGSLALQRGDLDMAEDFLRRAVDCERPLAIAANDLAETLRQGGRAREAVDFARRALALDPSLAVAYETAATSLAESGGDLAEARRLMDSAVELSSVGGRVADVRVLLSQARILFQAGADDEGRATIAKMRNRVSELSDAERAEYEAMTRK